MNILLLIFYHGCIALWGVWLTKTLFQFPKTQIVRATYVIACGLLISIPITYVFAVLLSSTPDPLFFSVCLFILTSACFFSLQKRTVAKKEIHQTFSYIDISVVVVCIGVSIYIMAKTFSGNGGQLSIARNTVFDTGHAISIIRSMSVGKNIPYFSPFVAGTDHLYHFLFHFWEALLEHFGLPLVLAVNVPGVVSFFVLLLTIYGLGREYFGKTLIGIIGIVLHVFHGGLLFIPFIQKYGLSYQAILRNPNYLFAGPFDGSIFSLFITLNVFVNQRHLGLALALFFLLYWAGVQETQSKKTSAFRFIALGFLVGCFTLLHIVLAIGLFFSLCLLYVLRKKWKELSIFCIASLLVGFMFISPWVDSLLRAIQGMSTGVQAASKTSPFTFMWFIEWIVQNLGLSLPLCIIGIVAYRSALKNYIPVLVLVGLFTAISIPAGIIDQKYLNVFLIFFILFTAAGIAWLWRKGKIAQVLIIAFFPFIIFSGVIDFMVIKNDYRYPVDDAGKSKLVSWILHSTSKESVFLSYQEMFDPVLLAGRKNYYGFFKQPDLFLAYKDKQRSSVVSSLYEAKTQKDIRQGIEDTNVDYIIVPLFDKPDFSYDVNVSLFRTVLDVVYEDEQHIVFTTHTVDL